MTSELPNLIISLHLQSLQISRFLHEAISDLLQCVTEIHQPFLQGQNQLDQTLNVNVSKSSHKQTFD